MKRWYVGAVPSLKVLVLVLRGKDIVASPYADADYHGVIASAIGAAHVSRGSMYGIEGLQLITVARARTARTASRAPTRRAEVLRRRRADPEPAEVAASMEGRRHFEAIIVGGGIAGASLAYFLAERGMTDVVLLEREEQPGL
jgi:NADPH-dependent 2,4-dienoyl-CoA reductase/sulfur reductase-like enzyme